MAISAVSFCGTKTTDRGVPYYKSNTGLTAGAIAGGIIGLSQYAQSKMLNPKTITDKTLKEAATKIKKCAVPLALTTLAVSTVCGAIVDHLRNKKAKETADTIAFSDPQTLMQTAQDVEISRYGTPYYKSNNGKKFGALLGIVYGLATFFASSAKSLPNKALAATSSIITGTVGGFIMGMMTDSITNKKAEKDFLPKNYLV